VLSRAATALYLIGRRLERADHLARLASVHQELALEGSSAGAGFWIELADCAGTPRPSGSAAEARRRAVGDVVAEVRASLQVAAEAARAVRPSISSEVFEQVNLLNGHFRAAEKPSAHQTLRDLQLGVHLVTGLVDDSMAHGPEREFLRIGRHLERTGSVTRLVACKSASAPSRTSDANDWTAVLRCAWSLEAYRVRGHRTPADMHGVAFALLFDGGMPRSARHAAERVVDISRVLGSRTDRVHAAADRLARLYRGEPASDGDALSGLQEKAAAGVARVESALRETYFMPTRILQRVDVADQQQ
jgi:uncharacterized alpha-E superfamily protein